MKGNPYLLIAPSMYVIQRIIILEIVIHVYGASYAENNVVGSNFGDYSSKAISHHLGGNFSPG